jgi:hypothetical protein
VNLHSIVGPLIGVVNPNLTVSIRVSTGYATAADGSRTPTFADPVDVVAQVQPVSWRDLQQMDGLNLQGVRRVVYLDGEIAGLVRSTNQGGDLITFPDGTIWLVAQILEGFSQTAGWCKAAITLQNGQ